jgi:hypothetical protein
MEAFILLLVLFLVAVLIVLPIWTIISVLGTRRETAELVARVQHLESRLRELRSTSVATSAPAAPTRDIPRMASMDTTPVPAAPLAPVRQPEAKPIPPAPLVSAESATFAHTTGPIVNDEITRAPFVGTTEVVRPQSPSPAARPVLPQPQAINWELFMGVKLFAWIGGLALFLGVAFFVKYSFENDLIPPEVRAALGFLAGAGLMAGGVMLSGKRYAVTGQTLCATGTVILYAVTFACHGLYHFAVFQTIPTFVLMALITTAAFLLAVRLEARVVAVLGMLGGFLTPVLISTGHDNPSGLFGYLALLDLGLIAVALHRRWHVLVPLGATGTVLMQLGWMGKFFAPEKVLTAITVNLGFVLLFLLAVLAARRLRQTAALLVATATALPFVSFALGLYFIGFPGLAAKPGTLFAFVLLADAIVLVLAWLEPTARKALMIAGAVVFVILAIWTNDHLTPALLPWALAIYLAFAALHTVGPLALARRYPNTQAAGWSQLWPVLTLLLMLGSLSQLPMVPLLFWPCVLLVDILAIWLAVMTASLTGLAAVLVLTLIATGQWAFKIPAELTQLPSLLLVVGGFALLFFTGGLWLVRRLGGRLSLPLPEDLKLPVDVRALIPSLSVLLPFALLVMVVTRLPLTDPSPVFGLALLLVVLALGLSRALTLGWLPAATLVGVLALESTWYKHQFQPENGLIALGWHLLFYVIFTVFPFVFKKAFATERGPWIVAALAGPLHFSLIHRVVGATWPNDLMGLLPVALALPALVALVAVARSVTVDNPQRLGRLAWFGGVALFFITLVFPIQFERQWITLGWALEGAALLWLFHRVPHPGLRLTGLGLLVAAFVRLALNPAVLSYHVRGDTPIFNWYLYAYGVTTIALFVGARLLAPPRDRVLGSSAPIVLNTLGVVLMFILLNIEIADFFSPHASVLTFQFSGNLARDMTYTIAWALFALGLLIVGIWKRQPGARYAALALLSVALLKLFFHDLANLGQLYRIGALVAVAIIAMVASFIYQRFLPSAHDAAPPPDPVDPSAR